MNQQCFFVMLNEMKHLSASQILDASASLSMTIAHQ